MLLRVSASILFECRMKISMCTARHIHLQSCLAIWTLRNDDWLQSEVPKLASMGHLSIEIVHSGHWQQSGRQQSGRIGSTVTAKGVLFPKSLRLLTCC